MEIYFFLLFWSLVSAVVCFIQGTTEWRKIIYLYLNFVPMALVGGLRAPSVGTDTDMYNQLFYSLASSTVSFDLYSDGGVEIGYMLLNRFAFIFSNDSQTLIFIMSFLTMLGFAYFFYMNSSCIWLSTFLFLGMFFFCESLNSIRQCLAGAIICNAYYFLKYNKNFLYCLSVFFAMCFHASALVFLPFCLLSSITGRKFCLFIGVVTLLSVMVQLEGLDLLIRFNFSEKYMAYIVSKFAEPMELGMGILKVAIFLILILISLCLNRWGKYNVQEKIDVYFCSIFLICACLATLAQYQIAIFYRFIFYFSIYACVLIPLIFKKIGILKFPGYLVVILSIVFYLDRMLSNNLSLKYYLYN